MDFRAVLIFFCLLTMQAVCGPVRKREIDGALNPTIQEIRKKIQSALKDLNGPAVLPNKTCDKTFSELVRPEQQNLTAHNPSSFGCLVYKVSKFIPELSSRLEIICQNIQDMVNRTISMNCSLPLFEEDLHVLEYTKCLLDRVDEWLSKAKF